MPHETPRRGHAHRRLSVRLLTLVTLAPLVIELCFFVSGVQREREGWLRQHLAAAELAAFTLARPAMPEDAATLRRMTGAEAIRVTPPGGTSFPLWPGPIPRVFAAIDPARETWFEGFSRALAAFSPDKARRAFVAIDAPPGGGALEIYLGDASLAGDMRHYGRRFLWFSVLLALSTGLLIFITLRAMLITPLARIAGNIAAFRADPQRGLPLDLVAADMPRDDEIGAVARELSAMQSELRTALWRNARLAAVGTAMAKMSHDLRGVLSAALLVADRLTMSREDRTREAGEVIVRAVHRATALAQSTLDFVRQGPPSLVRARVGVCAIVEEAAVAAGRTCAVANFVDPNASANVDRESLVRVFANLLRNAAQAGANQVEVASSGDDLGLAVTVIDNGPGLPEAVAKALFRPFGLSTSGGSGLGLAIARDLMRAHGGDLQLSHTGPDGTSFLLLMQLPKREE